MEDLVQKKQSKLNNDLATVNVMKLLTTSLSHGHFKTSTTAWLTELAIQLSCSRATYGLFNKSQSTVVAISHSAHFDPKSNLIHQIANTMDEAIDQDSVIVFPSDENNDPHVTTEAKKLHADQGTEFICTVPIIDLENKKPIGAITLERSNGAQFDQKTINQIMLVCTIAGPIFDLKYKNERGIIHKLKNSFKIFLIKILGKEHLLFKVFSLGLIIISIASINIEGLYRVTANANLEGSIQRVVTAPIDGFIAEAHVRAGDTVTAGQLMVSLDSKELELKKSTWTSQKQQYAREYREALATGNRAQSSIFRAQLNQAKAQITLINEQLSRTKLHAPFSGWIVSGDVSQSLGIPVERGQILFEVAPLDDYRIILQVDEREIMHIKPNQKGHVVLSGTAGKKLKFTTTAITPVATIKDGKNTFRVEAHLFEKSRIVRPGMQGIGKIEIDQRPLIWIWTHRFVNWMKIQFWRWWP
ncbi:MAG: HlyD family efflux transporter periplasmic adaptor subunit [Gammaproteobacteria bacterium]|nr:HlyD family efflux transporter periplasmic adaptor subunit [Gammaproteobacteria bacterium]